MNKLIEISGVRGYIDNKGTAQLNLEDVARGLGFTRIAASGNEVVRWERIEGYLREMGMPTSGHEAFIPENIFYRLAMKAKNQAAEKFQALVADEILPAIRKHGGYLTPEKLEEVLLSPDTLIRLATDLKTEREARLFAEKELQHKTQVITSLTEGITPPEKRQMLNRVVRRVPNYKHRWAELYRQFELKYHMNLGVRAKGGSKLEYIDGVLGQLDDLYDIACKLYESDMRKLVEELYRLREEAI